MKKFLQKIKFWYGNSRPYTVPITALCWFVAFVYSLKHGGNSISGIFAYIGIALLHLTTNLSDDYLDYIRLNKNGEFTNNEKSIKCKYLRNGSATIEELGIVILIILFVCGLIGGGLFLYSGWGVFLFAILTLPIVLLYSKLSSRGLGDFAVIMAYGPLLFGGVYYVMTKSFSKDIYILSFACAIFVETILYAHMLMDYDSDVNSGKTTLCTRLKSKTHALLGLIILYLTGYLFTISLALKTSNYLYFLPLVTIPIVIDLINSLKMYNQNPKSIPAIYPWHYPNLTSEAAKALDSAPFFTRFLYVRNIAVYFMLLTSMAIIFGK